MRSRKRERGKKGGRNIFRTRVWINKDRKKRELVEKRRTCRKRKEMEKKEKKKKKGMESKMKMEKKMEKRIVGENKKRWRKIWRKMRWTHKEKVEKKRWR